LKNIQDIVSLGRCIGCGMCYTVCVKGYIEYKKDGGLGFPVPMVVNCDDCGSCLRACPSSELYEDDDE
jgi:NAD-dependent dihydropyrimidine dehydrogenase PreA subunit